MGIVPESGWVDQSAVALAAKADAVILAAGFDPQSESEGWDRTFALPPGQDELIRAVVAANPNSIVVLTSGGSVDMGQWIDRVPAVVEVWYPGQEGGTALAEILFGDVNPSGHLPATFERRWEDNPSSASYYPASGTNRVEYSEGVFVGYRGFEKSGTRPLFPFGHGLSYTTFAYGNLTINPVVGTSGGDARWSVSFDITNMGARAGAGVRRGSQRERASSGERAEGFRQSDAEPSRDASSDSAARRALALVLRCSRQAVARGSR